LKGSADVFLVLKADSAGLQTRVLTLKSDKTRGTRQGELLRARLSWDEDSAQLSNTVASLPEPDLGTQFLGRLDSGPAFIEDFIALIPAKGRAHKTLREAADRVLKTLKEAGRVTNRLESGKLLWSGVSETGKEAA
jgi:hypothetical protein